MKKILAVLLFFSHWVNCQREADKIVLGGSGANPPIPFKNNILYISQEYGVDSVIGNKYLNINHYEQDQSLSTFWKENISYTSNGYKVVNHQGEVIEPMLYSEALIDTGQYIPLNYENSLFLNIKNEDQERVFLFYGQYKWYIDFEVSEYLMIYDTIFSYAELNPFNASADEALISKNNVLLSENDSTNIGGVVACRHANGRDWWIFKPGIYYNKFYRGLLSPDGIEMTTYLTDANAERNISILKCHFSADGKKFTALSDFPDKLVYVYDFDRCTGELSNLEVHDVNSFLYGTLYYNCLSPDGSKMYFYRYPYLPNNGNPAIIQYDFDTQQTYTLIEGLGLIPFTSPNGKQVCFFTVKIDSTQSISPRYLSVINSPNEFGAACDLNLYVQEIPNIVGFVPPNHAFFRLGAAEGTVCDSLGLSGVAALEELPNWSLYPNPNNGQFSLNHPNVFVGSYVIYHVMGQRVASGMLQREQTNIQTEDLSPGLYIIQLSDEKGQSLGSKKWVKTEN